MNLFEKLKNFSTSFKIKSQFFIQDKINKKRYLFLALIILYTPFSVYQAYNHPDEFTLLLTKGTQKISDIQIPQFARKVLFGAYSKWYRVDTEQMILSFQKYRTLSEFFTRKIKQRQINKQPNCLLSPCDGRVLAFNEINQDSCFVVKGYNYSLGELLCGDQIRFSKDDIQNLKKNKENKLYHIILYLAPGDYHRFHSPVEFSISRRKAIEGALYPVNQHSLIKRRVYEKNARLILHGKWQNGYLGMILVGALNVGRIVVKDNLNYKIGEQIGYFNLGSTILLLIESKELEWKINNQQKVKYGEILAKNVKVTVEKSPIK